MSKATARISWQRETRLRPYRLGDGPALHGDVGEAWMAAAREALPFGGGHLDLGCGTGRMTFALAERWAPGGWSVGADLDEAALSAARERARREGLAGAQFVLLDVEREEYAPCLPARPPDLVTAHLCMGPEIVERAARVLPPGGAFAFVALHPDLWKESGRPSRFSLSEEEVEGLLPRFGLAPSFLRSEKEVLEFREGRDAIEGYFQGGEAVRRWRQDGRWEAIRKHFEGGGRTLTTRAQLQGLVRKAPS